MFLKIKLYAAAVLAFFLALASAKHYRTKANKLKRQVVKEKAKAHNLEQQRKAMIRSQEKHKREIKDAVENGTYINHFDD